MTSVTVSFFGVATLEVYKHYLTNDKCCTIHMGDLQIQIRTYEELIKLEDALVEVRNYLSAFMQPPNEVQRSLPLVIKIGESDSSGTM